jgi:hypothetical protein
VLVDWDTVALARPERDLWMIVDACGTAMSAYRDLTGITLDPDAVAAYRLLWALTDMAAFTLQLRGEHRRDADAKKALAGLRSILNGREPFPMERRRSNARRVPDRQLREGVSGRRSAVTSVRRIWRAAERTPRLRCR